MRPGGTESTLIQAASSAGIAGQLNANFGSATVGSGVQAPYPYLPRLIIARISPTGERLSPRITTAPPAAGTKGIRSIRTERGDRVRAKIA